MISYRKFSNESDYRVMRSIVQHNCLQVGHLYPQLHIGNLDFERYALEENPNILYKTIWLVYEGEMEIGFITVLEIEFSLTLLSDYENFTQEILDYIEHNCYNHGVTILTNANSEDMLLNNILEQRGYTKTTRFRFNGMCDLSKISSCPSLSYGFSIRLTQKTDVAKRVELFRLATGGRGTTSECYERMMNSPSYSDALDLVVQSHNEEIIAYCTIWDDPISKIAILEPVACVAEYRRKGIMKNTLLYGMNLLKQRGTRYLYVGTGGKNIASQTLYKSVGFLEYGRNCEWQKTL
ncbi:MAG: GNAT family N-acetyltransferase [Clostridiaceae bacterium]|nr:GNAT family N-acetyltransferase [Clostridiaceae bacterium]